MSQPRKTPSQQRSRETVEFILEAAAHIFDREGMAGTTNRIAERAGVSIGSLYQYFPDKQSLVHELALRHLTTLRSELTASLQRAEREDVPLEDLLTELTTIVLDQHSAAGRLHSVLREFAPRSAQLVALFETTVDDLSSMLAGRLVDAGMDRADERARAAVAALDGVVHGAPTGLLDEDERADRIDLLVAQQLSVLRQSPTPR